MEPNGSLVINWDESPTESLLQEAASKIANSSAEWRLFPNLFISGEFLNFKFSAREEEEVVPEFNSAFHEHQFVAIRGLPLFFRFGYQLYDGKQKKTICRTTRAVYENGLERNDLLCLDYPLGRTLYRSKAKTTELNNIFRDSTVQLYGSRPLVEDPNSVEKRTCRDCVFAGEAVQVQGEVTNSCSVRGEIVFAVTQLGRYIVDPVEMTQRLEWKDIDKIPQKEVNSPYIVRIPINSSSLYSKIGNGEYDYPVRTQPAKNCPVPSDVKTIGDYWNWILANLNSLGGPTLPNRRQVLLAPTEIYNGKLITPKNNIESMLVARYNNELNKSQVKELAQTAWSLYTSLTTDTSTDFFAPEDSLKVITRKGK